MSKRHREFSLLLGSTLLTLALLEAAFRWGFTTPTGPMASFTTCQLNAFLKDGVPGYRPNQQCFQCYYREPPSRYFDKIIEQNGKRFECVLYRIGAQGFRTPSFERTRGQGKRVITLGDSFTFGEGVREQDTYPRLIQKNMGIETINLAMQGLNTTYERGILERNADLRPDLVILGFVLNDTFPHQETIRMVENLEAASRVPEWLEFSHFGSFFYRRVSTWRQSRNEIEKYFHWFETRWPETSRELATIRDFCHQHQAKFLLVLFPIFTDLDQNYPFLALHQKIGEFARQNKIPFLDLLSEFQGEPAEQYRVHPLDHHPNHKAHARAYSAIEKWMKENPL